MNKFSPEQMRALARRADVYGSIDANGLLDELAAALRAAADQLEAVQSLYCQGWNDIDDERWEDDWSRGRMSALRDVRAALTVVTAPQKNRNE